MGIGLFNAHLRGSGYDLTGLDLLVDLDGPPTLDSLPVTLPAPGLINDDSLLSLSVTDRSVADRDAALPCRVLPLNSSINCLTFSGSEGNSLWDQLRDGGGTLGDATLFSSNAAVISATMDAVGSRGAENSRGR